MIQSNSSESHKDLAQNVTEHTEPFRVVFVVPVEGQPRFSKRVRGLQRAELVCRVLSFHREYFNGRALPVEVEGLGKIDRAGLLSRVVQYIRAIPSIRKASMQSDVIYVFGSDLLLLARVATLGLGRIAVLEVGDLRSIQLERGWRGVCVRLLDKLTVASADLLVVTAKGYVRDYYRGWLGLERMASMVIENKLDEIATSRAGSMPLGREESPKAHWTIGYFGLLRSEISWGVLSEVAERAEGRVEILVAGHPRVPHDLVEQIERHPYARYFGEYRWPEDLAQLYGSVDMVWACYPFPQRSIGNWQWARTNRFYESCFFGKPLVSLKGSDEGDIVDSLSIGITVDPFDRTDAVEQLLSIGIDRWAGWRENMKAVPKSWYCYSQEHEELAIQLKRLARSATGEEIE